MSKLSGVKYVRYWHDRHAKDGAAYVGNIHKPEDVWKQGERFWQAIVNAIEAVSMPDPTHIVELGCGVGRITRLLAARWPKARVTGIDITPGALATARIQVPEAKFINNYRIPFSVAAPDLVVTCTCLQHITDPEVYADAVRSIKQRSKRKAWLVMLENNRPGPRAKHMAERVVEDYQEDFSPEFEVRSVIEYGSRELDKEPHAVIVARKGGN